MKLITSVVLLTWTCVFTNTFAHEDQPSTNGVPQYEYVNHFPHPVMQL